MSGQIVLRDYRASDLDAMFELDELCFSKEFRFDRESMREFAEEPAAVVLIAEKDDTGIVGFVIVHVERMASELTGYVITLDVASDCRRKELATHLMREAESRVLTAGARWIQLHVFIGNAGAIRFYERMGYQRIRVQRGFYGRAGDAILYAKELTPDS